MQTSSTCPTCKGSGQIIVIDSGVDASGLEKETIIEIDIPAGVEHGMQLSMQGKGNEAPGGGVSGDLIVAIEEIEHEHGEKWQRFAVSTWHIVFCYVGYP